LIKFVVVAIIKRRGACYQIR